MYRSLPIKQSQAGKRYFHTISNVKTNNIIGVLQKSQHPQQTTQRSRQLVGHTGFRNTYATLTKNKASMHRSKYSNNYFCPQYHTKKWHRLSRTYTNTTKIWWQQQQQQRRQQSSSSGGGGGSNQGGADMTDVEFLGICFFRLLSVYGVIYCLAEYVFQLTQCDGPSMLPTIKSSGEIILIDRLSPTMFGIQGGCIAEERTKMAREKQSTHGKKTNNDGTWHEQYVIDQKRKSNHTHNDAPPPTTTGTATTTTTTHPKQTLVQKYKRLFRTVTSPLSIGDVIVLKHPTKEGQVCKRLIGLPGDQVFLSNHGNKHDEGVIIPDGHIWVEGDNKNNSTDSRVYGTVPATLIIGRAMLRVWPVRGNAILERHLINNVPHDVTTTTVIPAGYQGEKISFATN